jgi:transposase
MSKLLKNSSEQIFLSGFSYRRRCFVPQKERCERIQKRDENEEPARLPSYSPDRNPIEKLWKNTKRDATHLKYFPTFDDLRSAVIGAFEKYLTDATKIICVMKKLRKEAGIS